MHGPGGSKIARDYLAKFQRSHGVGIIHGAGTHSSRVVCHQVGPDAKRKMIVSDLSYAEGARTQEPRRSLQRQKPGDA